MCALLYTKYGRKSRLCRLCLCKSPWGLCEISAVVLMCNDAPTVQHSRPGTLESKESRLSVACHGGLRIVRHAIAAARLGSGQVGMEAAGRNATSLRLACSARRLVPAAEMEQAVLGIVVSPGKGIAPESRIKTKARVIVHDLAGTITT